VREVINSRGKQEEEKLRAFLDAGFTKQNVLEVMLLVSVKTLWNYINHLTQPETNAE